MTTIPTETCAEKMKGIASVQASNTREQDRKNAWDAWQAANPGIRKTATPVIRKKVVKKKKVEEKVQKKKHPTKEVESDWDRVTAFWSSCFSLDPIKPDH